MRHSIRVFLESVQKFTLTDNKGVVVEMGAYNIEGQDDISNIKSIFPSATEYYACDMREGPGVDRIENVQHMSFDDSSISLFIMLDVLEHVQDPFNAMKEVHRVLDDKGLVVISSVMDFPIHAHPDDYWRYTPSGFLELCSDFENVVVFSEGYERQPHSVMAIASKSQSISNETIELIKQDYMKNKYSPMNKLKLFLKEIVWGSRRFFNRNNLITTIRIN